MSEKSRQTAADDEIRYEPTEGAPAPLAAGIGLQLAAMVLFSTALIPVIVFRSAGASETDVWWAVSASLVLCGLTTVMQATRFGAGYIILTGTSSAAVAISIAALSAGGPALLALLVAVSSLFQVAVAARLSVLRRIFTPAIAGTVLMLIPASIMPPVLGALGHVPEGIPPEAAAFTAFVTLAVIAAVSLKGGARLRLWASVIGFLAGALCAVPFGFYDIGGIADAPWIGLPEGGPPALAFDIGPDFWGLLPAFVLVTLIGTVQSVSGAIGVQRVSWRMPRAVDYRSVQNAVALAGLGNVVCGLAGTMPNASRTTGASVAALTGVASRRVGIAVGAWLLAFAFLPKAIALVLAVPGPVIAAYFMAMLATLFMIGVRVATQDGMDHHGRLIVGISFSTGLAFQYDLIFPELVSAFAGGLLGSGITAGGIIAIALVLFIEMTSPRSRRFKAEFTIDVLPQLRVFLSDFAERCGWGREMARRLEAASEETLLTLLREDESDDGRTRLLRVTARKDGRGACLEFVASVGEDENLQDRIALLGEEINQTTLERDVSLRLLRHLASSVRHQQYHSTDIVTVVVEAK